VSATWTETIERIGDVDSLRSLPFERLDALREARGLDTLVDLWVWVVETARIMPSLDLEGAVEWIEQHADWHPIARESEVSYLEEHCQSCGARSVRCSCADEDAEARGVAGF
jgi:hypothetical protein